MTLETDKAFRISKAVCYIPASSVCIQHVYLTLPNTLLRSDIFYMGYGCTTEDKSFLINACTVDVKISACSF